VATDDQTVTSAQSTSTTAPVTSTSSAGATTTTGRVGSSTTRRVTTTRPQQPTTAVGSPDPALGDPLGRRDVPEEGVPAQLQFLAHTDAPCEVGGPAPAVIPQSGRHEIGSTVSICVSGFDSSGDVTVTLTLPGGQTRQQLLRNVASQNDWSFDLDAEAPVGSYRITAVQGAVRATGGFDGVLPDRPRIETLDPGSGSPGAIFRFAIVSPRPNQAVTIDLYRQENNRQLFAATLGRVTTDGRARASYEVPTRSDSPAGTYCLVARPFDNVCASFTVR
jgi:hypothetical protein